MMSYLAWMEAQEGEKQYTQPLYFGCKNSTGHYVWTATGKRLWGSANDPVTYYLELNDGKLAPKTTKEQGKVVIHQFPWATILAFWDYSVDKRPGSNSMFLLPPSLSFSEALPIAQQAFPDVFARFKFDVQFLRNEFHSEA